jgi:hypothetical protein
MGSKKGLVALNAEKPNYELASATEVLTPRKPAPPGTALAELRGDNSQPDV